MDNTKAFMQELKNHHIDFAGFVKLFNLWTELSTAERKEVTRLSVNKDDILIHSNIALNATGN